MRRITALVLALALVLAFAPALEAQVIVGGKMRVVATNAASTTLTASRSGTVYVNTATTGTTTFVLPAAAAGLYYCFVEGGDAAGEILINVQTGDNVVGKTH
ncbi:MAG TPA: hypothetical protein VEA38_26190, partial [Terriglobales bacterium]|nr:hypothetical protein [Terriglobales bacterium]